MTNAESMDFRLLAEYSADIICRSGLDRRMKYVSPSSLPILGWTPEEIVAMPAFGLVLPEDIPVLAETIKEHLTPGVTPKPFAFRIRKKQGGTVWMEVSARVVRDPQTDEAMETVLVMRDISERKLLEDRLSALAHTDGLTGLANRRAFDEVLAREWQKAAQSGAQLSLILLDVDRFKRFNDRYGHQVGDDCLRSIAHAVQSAVRSQIDTAARYGGEEIAAILPSIDSSDALIVAERLRQSIMDLRIPHAGNEECGSVVTASIGLATALARNGGTIRMPEGLLMSADHALYKAKHEGRNRVADTILVASTLP